MTFTMELTPEQEQRLAEKAEAQGKPLDSFLRDTIEAMASSPEPSSVPGAATLALLAKWREEDATDDEEELARRDAETEEPAISARNQALIDLISGWREEDATDDEEELERRDADWQELKANLLANPVSFREWHSD